ncbi:MAG: hypothetical protein LBG66_05280 [Gallionellaceae bacterium]|nr:hypothetical protein [Gallionellaceae bacterium]
MKNDALPIADGQIEKFSYHAGGALTVRLQLDGQPFEIIFRHVLGIKAFSPEGEDLSHLAERNMSPFLVETCGILKEAIGHFKEFSFISAWTDEPLLIVIARSAEKGTIWDRV